jgi:hypothetical protein
VSTRNLAGGKGRPAREADLGAECLENVGASTSHNPMGLHSLLQGELYLFYFFTYCNGIFLQKPYLLPQNIISEALAYVMIEQKGRVICK